MPYEDFLADVQERGGYPAEDAERITDAVVTTLGERLTPQSAGHLADQLPIPLAEVLNEAGAAAQSWGVEEFVTQIAEATGADEVHAEADARAVLSSLADQINGGELDELLSHLPTGYADLFGYPELT